jgi:hypothetical protein
VLTEADGMKNSKNSTAKTSNSINTEANAGTEVEASGAGGVGSIKCRAMLVALKISTWSARKYDRKASNEVANAHGASEDAGRYNKLLVAREALAEIIKVDGQLRTYHYKHTLPWSDEGSRILPAAHFMTYSQAMKLMRRERAGAVEKFLGEYPELVKDARARLKTLFNKADYPGEDEIESRFRVDISLMPFPDSEDFRVNLADERVEEIRAEIEERVNGAVGEATKSLWQRVYEQVAHMSERLKIYDEPSPKLQAKGKKATKPEAKERVANPFRDSLVENLRELAGLLPTLNFVGDPELNKMAKRLERELCEHEPEVLRSNKELRVKQAKTADQILASMRHYVS